MGSIKASSVDEGASLPPVEASHNTHRETGAIQLEPRMSKPTFLAYGSHSSDEPGCRARLDYLFLIL
jgi:hypothetical protein